MRGIHFKNIVLYLYGGRFEIKLLVLGQLANGLTYASEIGHVDLLVAERRNKGDIVKYIQIRLFEGRTSNEKQEHRAKNDDTDN